MDPGRAPGAARGIWGWLVALLIAALAIVGGAYLWTTKPDTKEVPAVIGLPGDEARSRLRNAGFRVELEREISTRPEGVVLRQQPETGAQLEQGSRVGITTSSGPPEISVPRLVGIRRGGAERLLRTLRLEGEPTLVQSDEPAGVVISQNPPAASKVSRGTRIFYTVSRGPQLVEVPPLRGLTQERATRRLTRLGLVASVRGVRSAEPRGTVTAQDPPREQEVRRGTRVTINVSRGLGLVTVPGVRGLTEERARAQLEAVGLVPVIVPVDSPRPRGTVVAQDPARQQRVPAGTNVRLNVSAAD